MAKEHVYTRTGEGFFTHCEGYDTIALSKDLTYEYVRKNIYPLCFYEKHGNLDTMPCVYYYKYIENPEGGANGVVFGKNKYIYSSRNYIMCNSLIIYGIELELLNKNFENFLEFDFYSENITKPCVLEDIDISNYLKPYYVLKERDFIFNLFDMNVKKYKSLLYNIIQSIEKKQTLYIKLNCERKFCNRYAKKLIKLLFINIPSSLKKQLSYITYSPFITLKIFFHIVFLDKDTDIKNLDICSFDFCSDVDFNKDSPFLEFAWKNILLANKILLESEFYGFEYNGNLLIELDKSVIRILELYKSKFTKINKFSPEDYIDTLNLFFDLRVFYSKEAINWIKSIKSIDINQRDLENKFVLMDMIDFLCLKKPVNNENSFALIVYNYYNLDFNKSIDYIIKKINSLNNFEDFLILSFFYLNYMKGLLNKQNLELVINNIKQKIFCFEEKTDIRKENINGLSVYLWKRYREWI